MSDEQHDVHRLEVIAPRECIMQELASSSQPERELFVRVEDFFMSLEETRRVKRTVGIIHYKEGEVSI